MYLDDELEKKNIDPLARRMREWRCRQKSYNGRRLNQHALAAMLGYHVDVIRRVELGDSKMSPKFREDLEKFLELWDNPKTQARIDGGYAL